MRRKTKHNWQHLTQLHVCVCVCVCGGAKLFIRWFHLAVALSQCSAVTPLLTSCLLVFLVALSQSHTCTRSEYLILRQNNTSLPLLQASQAPQLHGLTLLTWLHWLCLSYPWYDQWKTISALMESPLSFSPSASNAWWHFYDHYSSTSRLTSEVISKGTVVVLEIVCECLYRKWEERDNITCLHPELKSSLSRPCVALNFIVVLYVQRKVY